MQKCPPLCRGNRGEGLRKQTLCTFTCVCLYARAASGRGGTALAWYAAARFAGGSTATRAPEGGLSQTNPELGTAAISFRLRLTPNGQ